MNWREELRNFKKDPDVDKYLQMLTSDDEDTLRYGVAILESKYPFIYKNLAYSLNTDWYKNQHWDVEESEIRIIDCNPSKGLFRELLDLFYKKGLLKDKLTGYCKTVVYNKRNMAWEP